MSADSLERAADKIVRLSGGPRDVVTFWQDVTEVLVTAVPHYWTPCWYTLDPASLLLTSHFHLGLAEFPAQWLREEYATPGENRIVDVVRSPAGIGTLHEATGGDPSGSERWKRNMTMGGDQEMIARLSTRSGEAWGALGLYREPGRPLFDDVEKRFVTAVAPALADGVRRALLIGQAQEPEYPDSPGLLVLTAGCDIESATPGTERWLSDLPDGDWDRGRLPTAVLTLAARTLQAARDAGGHEITVARVLSRSGTWLVLHGACLNSTANQRIAVIVEPAHPDRIFPLLMSAYGLTHRERDITQLVLQGASTSQIAADLTVSVHTVQQHLKSIFDKTGVHSRRELVTKVFFTHYEPRFRDNEQRAATGRPVRGGPWPPAEGAP